jgi:peptide deformylase
MKQQRKKMVAAAPAVVERPEPQVLRPEPQGLQLVLYPDPTLKKVARAVEHFDDWLRAVVERMKDLMVEHKGVGLAAPQVGLPLRIFVASPTGTREEAAAYINPTLLDERGSEEGEEGCLSLPEIRIKVSRFTAVRIEALDPSGQPFGQNAEAFAARVLQHENDHLEGILLLDRMSPLAKLANRKKIKDLESKK